MYHTIIFWIYWLIAALFGAGLITVLFKEKNKDVQMIVALLLVPTILRLLLIK